MQAGVTRTGAVHAAAPADAAQTNAALSATAIARALALGFARRGWQVALAVGSERERPAAAALAAEVEALGGRAAVLVADLAAADGAARLVPACSAALGRPACVVTQSGPADAGADSARDVDHAALLDALARSVVAPLVLGRALYEATPDTARSDEAQRATLIHLLDQARFDPAPLAQVLAQAALQRATAAQALALAPKVRVASLVRGRAPHADELAEAACYLADAAGITGATLTVDGGEHLAPAAGR